MSEKILKVTFEANEEDLVKFNKLLKEAGISAKELEEKLDDTGKATDSLGEVFGKVKTAVTAFIAAAAVKEIFNIGLAASKAAAEVEGMESAFKNLGGTAMDLDKLSKAVGGTQSKVTLMKLSIQALQKGAGFKDIEKALGFVAKQADATNQSFEGLSETLIDAIGKKSAKGLQALGLNAKLVEENGKKIGFMPALLEEIGKESAKLGVINTETADGYTKVGLAQKEMQLALGRFLNSKAATGFSNYWADVATNIVKAFDEAVNGPELGLKSMESLQKRAAELTKQQKEAARTFATTSDSFAMSGVKRDAVERYKKYGLELQAINKEITERETAERVKAANAKKVIDDEAALTKLHDEEDAAKKLQEQRDKEAAEELRFIEWRNNKILEMNRDRRAKDFEESQKTRLEQSKDTKQAFENLLEQVRFGHPGEFDTKPKKLGGAEFTKEMEKNIGDLRKQTGLVALDEKAGDIAKANKLAADQAERLASGFQLASGAAQGIVDAVHNLNNQDVSSASAFGSILSMLAPFLSLVNPALGAGAGAIGGVLQQFNEGGWVDGHGPDRDTVVARLTPGEHVTRRKHAQRSPLLLDAINSGEIDDRIFLKLNSKQNITVDQSQVVEAIQSIPVTELYKSGSALFEHRLQSNKKVAGRKKRVGI